MSDERLKTLLTFLQFLLGTVIIGGFASYINSDIQRREVEIKEQDQISKNLSTVLSPNIADRQLMAEYYAAVTRSDDIRKRWEVYRDLLRKEIDSLKARSQKVAAGIDSLTDSKVLDQKMAEIQKIESQTTPGAVPRNVDELVPRVYFHIARESDRPRAAKVAAQLMQVARLTVPGIQRVTTFPSKNELRYFKLADAVEAEAIVGELKKLRTDVDPKYIAGYESVDKLRPHHFELWLSERW